MGEKVASEQSSNLMVNIFAIGLDIYNFGGVAAALFIFQWEGFGHFTKPKSIILFNKIFYNIVVPRTG